MREESGRSLIEILGVLAISGFMTIAALGVFNTIRNNQTRTIADSELRQIAENTKILMEMRGSYEGVSVDYLVKAGAIPSDKQPIGGKDWSVTSSFDGAEFSINLVDLSYGECEYFSATVPTWAVSVKINGFETGTIDNCFKTKTNQLSFIVD